MVWVAGIYNMTIAFIDYTPENVESLASIGIKPARLSKYYWIYNPDALWRQRLAIHDVSETEQAMLRIACTDVFTYPSYTAGEILVANGANYKFFRIERVCAKSVFVIGIGSHITVDGGWYITPDTEKPMQTVWQGKIREWGIDVMRGHDDGGNNLTSRRWDGKPVKLPAHPARNF